MKIIKCKSIDKLIVLAYEYVKLHGGTFKKADGKYGFRLKYGKISFKTYNKYDSSDLYRKILASNISVEDFVNKQLMPFI